jgi:hypothetical protein
MLVVSLTGCNRQLIDTTYRFDKAVIGLPNGDVIEGKVQSWKDYDNSDQIQVKVDGKTYLVHSMNVTLIAE